MKATCPFIDLVTPVCISSLHRRAISRLHRQVFTHLHRQVFTLLHRSACCHLRHQGFTLLHSHVAKTPTSKCIDAPI